MNAGKFVADRGDKGQNRELGPHITRRIACPINLRIGNAPGYVGTEFPILPFIAAVCYKFAGVHEWIGRIQAVVLFAVSLPFFFLLVREVYGSTAAVWATFFYGFAPANIFAGRSFMPDVPSLSLAIIGLCLFLRWMESRKPGLFSVAAIAISMSLLFKVTNIVIVA